MSEKLIKPYEISVWEDKLIQDGNEYKLIENKIAVIGSDKMTGLNKVYDPIFNKKTNGEKTLTFSLKYKYFDPYSGNEEVINPFVSLLTNERKVKLHYDNKWYEFIVKEHTESSEDYEWTYTCNDAFVLELSKSGYNLTFDAELNNNQGTATGLASTVLEDTDWKLGEQTILKQLIAEPIYKATLVSTSNIEIINATGNEDTIPTAGSGIYLFYTYVKNQDGKNIQFIIRDENREYVIDDKNVITDTNFRITTELFFKEDHFENKEGTTIISWGDIETKYQANRLAYGQLTTYDPVLERTVSRFETNTEPKIEIYKYTDYVYTTSNTVMNYFTNGDNFNTLEDGSLQGWNPYVDFEKDSEDKDVKKLELVMKPEIGAGKTLVDIAVLSQTEGFMKAYFPGALNAQYQNAIFNSGFENNASFIKSVAVNEKFVFRWRAGQGDVDSLTPATDLRVLVAKYDQDAPTFGRYYKHIRPDDIILNFNTGTPVEYNNYVTGGTLEESETSGKYNYVINDVVQTPSVKYIYVNDTDNKEYVWNGLNGTFEEKTESNYLPYYYLVAEAKQGVSNTVLSDVTKIGIFIYNITGEGTYFIEDVQLTRFIPDSSDPNGETPILIGNVPTATSQSTDYYYVKPEDDTAAEDIVTYIDLKDLASELGIDEEDIYPKYNENSEKTLSISVSKSNRFDILQTIAETFECWVDLVVEHDENGYIAHDENGNPEKYVFLKEFAGKDNWAGFKYGINLNSIERDVDSTEFVTKLIVEQSQSDYVDEGFVSIASAPSNISGEAYILNFEYYYSQNLLNREEAEIDKLSFISGLAQINQQLKEKEKLSSDLEISLIGIGSKRNTYTELVNSAKSNKTDALGEFEELTNRTYEEYQQLQTDPQTKKFQNNLYVLTEDTEVDTKKTYYVYEDEEISPVDITEQINPQALGYYELLPDYTQEETIIDLIGQIYATSATINNYSGLLTNIEEEYWEVRRQLRGLETYNIKVWVGHDILGPRHVFVELNDYLPGFKFVIDGSEYESTVSQKYFDIETNGDEITFTVPSNYTIKQSTYEIIDGQVITFSIIPNEEKKGIASEIDALIKQKEKLIKDFENKYSRFIQEGTWNSTDYIDSELYYLDAIQVSNTSAQPVVSYTINVVEISELEGFEWYLFDTGEKTYVEDPEFFGWSEVDGVLTPAREEVIISEVEWHLEEPDQNTITVQNYKTRFEDLFQRISATVQTVEYNEATYAKTSTLLDADGTINQNVLLNSLNNVSGKQYALTSDGSIIINDDVILVRNLTNPANHVIINSEGIRVSSDGGENYTTVIDGQGINIGAVYTGSLNTNEVIIGSNENPSFRWDKAGISAYKLNESNPNAPYDLQTFVRYDQYGLYGIKNNGSFKANSLQDVLDKAHFAVTWDGFFIKNSYPGGGRVEITSDNDFRVMNIPEGQVNEQEKIKIGALEWGKDGQGNPIISPDASGATYAPTLYGIRIKNNSGDTVMKTGDDGNLEITGTIYANAGEIGGVIIDSDKLKMDHIILEPGVGIYSDYGVQSGQTNYPFIISDTSGKATFRDIEALGGLLSNLLVKDTITVGDSSNSGLIKSQNYTTGVSGWAIKSDGSAEFQNAVVRGEVNAGSGNFYGAVTVGKENAQDPDYIMIDGQNALIRSANYLDGAGAGWLINNEGDAYFNNITARGAIKTAVFEYAEIQAVGGIFIFRPSSTIKGARISGNDLILKVEKPFLFAKVSYNEISDPDPSANPQSNGWYERTNYGYRLTEDTTVEDKQYYSRSDINNGSWCKISNYLSDGAPADSTIQNILLTNGLTHVYQISNVNTSTNEVTLDGAAAFIGAVKQTGETDDDVLKQLEGGALIDMGRKDGSSNYGIGVNSSDNTVNLPARAISLFETEIDETKDVKVTYNYRGILGTLPTLPATDVSDTIYNSQMAGTQGIYTDNMYIGDASQYIAFYEDEHGNKQLRIKANQIVYEVVDEDTGQVDWHDVSDIEAEGVPGPPGPAGQDAIIVKIDSSAGEVFLNKRITTTLTCTVIKGNGTDITNQVTRFNWIKKNADGTVDTSWSRPLAGNTISISEADVTSKAIFICEVEF